MVNTGLPFCQGAGVQTFLLVTLDCRNFKIIYYTSELTNSHGDPLPDPSKSLSIVKSTTISHSDSRNRQDIAFRCLPSVSVYALSYFDPLDCCSNLKHILQYI